MALINLYPNVADPKDLPKILPCLECLTEDQLKKVLIWELNELTNSYTLPAELATLISDSSCYTCLSDKQLLQSIIVLLGYLTWGSHTVSEVTAEIACLNCGNPAQVKAAIVHLIAKWVETQQLV